MSTFPRIAARLNNTNRVGGTFDERTINAVWNRARIVPGANPNYRRMDACGAFIDRLQYGQTIHHGTGWEIDHILPISRGGSDDLSNLQPLQWQNNREKGDQYPIVPSSYCAVKARL